MSYLVALEVQNNELLVAIARSSGKRIQLDQMLKLDGLDELTDVEIGERLKSQLNELRITKCEAIAVVSRQDAEIREITVPPAPDNELPDMIRFKARSDFGLLNENWALDFVPFGGDPTHSRDVLAAAVPPEQIERYQTICETANLRLKHILFGPFAGADLLRPKLLDGDCRLVVVSTPERFNLTVTRGTKILTTRSVKAPADDGTGNVEKQLIGVAKRTLASVAKRLDGAPVNKAMILNKDEALAEPLKTGLDMDVERIDPFALVPHNPKLKRPDDADRYGSLFGALLQQDAGLGHEIDFLNPRKKVVRQIDVRRFATIAGAAVVGFICFTIIGWWVLSNQSAEITTFTEKRNRLKQENAGTQNGVQTAIASKQIIGEVGKVDSWKINDVNWLEELYQISDRFMSPDDAIVDSFEASLRGGRPKIQIVGRLSGAEADKELKQTLMKRPFRVSAPKTTMTDDDTYPQSYEYTLGPTQELKSVTDAMDKQAREYLRQLNSQTAPTSTETASQD